MARINWTNNYNVGINVIDFQHKEVIKIINCFYQSQRTRQNGEKLYNILTQFEKTIKYHFLTEENIIRQFDNLEQIKYYKEKKEILSEIEFCKNHIKEGKFIFSLHFSNYLRDWIRKHLNAISKLNIDISLSRYSL